MLLDLLFSYFDNVQKSSGHIFVRIGVVLMGVQLSYNACVYMCVCVCLRRLVEFNGRLVCGLSVGKFHELMTSCNPGNDPCRIVVLRETLETDLEYNSLSQDISEW